jgi:hypothetical protein
VRFGHKKRGRPRKTVLESIKTVWDLDGFVTAREAASEKSCSAAGGGGGGGGGAESVEGGLVEGELEGRMKEEEEGVLVVMGRRGIVRREIEEEEEGVPGEEDGGKVDDGSVDVNTDTREPKIEDKTMDDVKVPIKAESPAVVSRSGRVITKPKSLLSEMPLPSSSPSSTTTQKRRARFAETSETSEPPPKKIKLKTKMPVRPPSPPKKQTLDVVMEDDGDTIDCVCEMPNLDLGTLMVGCEGCMAWFHADCVGYTPPAEDNQDAEWLCPRCIGSV